MIGMANENGLMMIRKVAELLTFLAQGEATVAEIVEATGEPRSSIYRLLSGLQSEDFVEPGTRRGRFRLGMKLLPLGAAVVARFDERRLAQPVMERLHDLTGETVFLCVPRRDEAVCVDRLAGKRVQSLALGLGGSLPLHAGAASRALLAYREESEWDDYIRRNSPLVGFTPATVVESTGLKALLARTRENGLAVSDQDVTVGVAALGVAITDYKGQVRGALSISGLRESVLGDSFELWSDALIAAGHEVSRALGCGVAGGQIADFG
jgi:DNA-binding IclR family transcriptional regulator